MAELVGQTFSKGEARAIAVHAQGFNGLSEGSELRSSLGAGERSNGSDLLAALDHLSLFQIDSVNVFERAHYMPAFSRIGSYDRTLLDLAHSPAETVGGPGENAEAGTKAGVGVGANSIAARPTLIEYWAHEASLIRVEDLPLHQWRMHKYRATAPSYSADFARDNEPLFEWLKAYLADVGPQTAGDVEHPANVRKPGTWWHHNDIKRALEVMFLRGELVAAGRKSFSRRYGLPEQVLPAEVHAALNTDNYDERPDRKALLTRAAVSYGIASARDLADYHRQHFAVAKPLIEDLVSEGTLLPVQVEGVDTQHYLHKDANLTPQNHIGTTIVSPFDPLVWHRPRTEALFDFHYRIEIYTPEPKRIFGYYTLPILHNGNVVGRIDLKSDRQNGKLVAKASWHETWMPATATRELAAALAKHLRQVAIWQGLNSIEVAERGNLAAALAKAVQAKA